MAKKDPKRRKEKNEQAHIVRRLMTLNGTVASSFRQSWTLTKTAKRSPERMNKTITLAFFQ